MKRAWLARSLPSYRRARMALAAALLLVLPAARPQGPQSSAKAPATTASSATTVPSKPQTAAVDYSNEPFVVEHSTTLCRYNADGTGTRTLQATLHLQSDAAVRQFGVLSFPFAADDERVELSYVRVRKADGTVISTDTAAAQDLPAEVTRQAPLYSDLHQLQLPVRSLAVGDRIDYQAVYRTSRASAPGQFWNALNFERQAVSPDQAIELRYPASLHVTVLSPGNKPVTSRDDADLVYRWHAEQREPTVAPPGGTAPSDSDKPFPRTVPDVAWTTFPDWAAVGAWYRTLAGDRAVPSDALRAKAAALTAGAATDDESIARIYSFVSMQIRYIGVDFGIGRFQSHPAAEVLSNGYGDCKDKHTLLAALLTAAGFHAEPVLIGANIEIDRDLPAPNSFNHVITVVERPGGTRLWLDSTAEVAPVGMLVESLRDKDALLIPTAPNSPSALIRTPAAPPFAAFDRYDSRGTIAADGKLSAHFTVTLRGDFELLTRAALFTSGRGGWAAVGQQLSSSLGFGGTVSAFQPTAVDTPEQPLHFTYDYQRDSLGDWPNHRIIALIPGSFFGGVTYSKQPEKPIDLGAPRTETSQSTLVLPDGLTVPAMPSDLHAKSSFGTFDVTYKLHGSELVTEERLTILVPSIPAGEWQHYNTFIDDMSGNTGVFIALAEGQPRTAEAASVPADHPAASVTDTDAQTLIAEAASALQSGNMADAAGKLAAARARNPEQPGLLAAEGLLAAGRNDFATAEADIEKEAVLHPALRDSLLPSLLFVQLRQKQSAAAITTLEALRKSKPDDIGLARQEGALLTKTSRHEEAISLLQGVALHHPSDTYVLLSLGRAQLAAGRNREGQATLESLLENASDPEILNDAAYELADRNLDLPLAAADAEKAIGLLEAETAGVSLDALTPRQLARQNLLGATWDTCGWIAYLQGHLPLAESYLRSAWVQFSAPDNGYHLGAVLEKEGKPGEALVLYTLAGTHADTGPSGPPEMQAMSRRRNALLAQGLKVDLPQGESVALANVRSLHLPLYTKEHTEAEFFVLASASAVEKVVFLEGDPRLKDKTTALQQALTHDRSSLPFPLDSHAHLARRAALSCSPLTRECQLTFYLPQDTRVFQPSRTPATALATASSSHDAQKE